MINGHGDDAYRYGGILHNFSSNIFSHADLSGLQRHLTARLAAIASYPEPEARALARLIATRHGVGEDCVVVTNGATEAIYMIAEAIADSPHTLICGPTFSEYADACRLAGINPTILSLSRSHPLFPSLRERGLGEESVWLCNPNNPTGTVVPKAEVRQLAAACRCLILDQSYEDYTLEPLLSAAEAVGAGNILQLHSLTKAYCIPGLRIGYVIGAPSLIASLRQRLRPWAVNALAIEAATWLLQGDVRVLPDMRAYLTEAQRLRNVLNALPGITAAPTQTNFMLCRLDERRGITAAQLKEHLARRHGILIRDAANFEGLTPWHFRVAAQTREEDDLLADALQLKHTQHNNTTPPATHPIMLVGTGSDVGKSVLATALCRILRQDGFHPAPFKAQNMALNSYATPEGLEIGRAQAVQAEAAGIPCHTDMNPLLLKPQSDHTSQVVLHGRPVGNRDAYDFWRRGTGVQGCDIDFRAEVCGAFDRLAARYCPIVMEGAGSISELNLRHTDLVNLPMARHAGADVILVGDIDRGGVFASLYGSIALLPPNDRARIKGIIINKFRGDLRLFDEGRRMLEELCGIPVLGVIPYFEDIHIEEEDSMALEKKRHAATATAAATVAVAVVLLRHLSNYTDFDALEQDPRIHLFYTNNTDDLRRADIIILPGTKATLDDLRELRRNGCAEAIRQAARRGTTVIGICGGYQMMGVEVCDPAHVEGDTERLPGLALLPVTTSMTAAKVTRQIHFTLAPAPVSTSAPAPAPSSASISPSSAPAPAPSLGLVSGGFPAGFPSRAYEIHMGATRPIPPAAAAPLALLADGTTDGYRVNDRCWGTYLHGILDNAAVVDSLLAPFADRFSPSAAPFDYAAFKEAQYDRLAAHVRAHLDMQRLYAIMHLTPHAT